VARPIRYTFILALAALATALAAVGGWRYARASAPVNGPIILISVDTLRADHLPTYGYRKVRTPAIDTLAADGTVFERAYSHSPQTLPAHTALLSGRLPFETGVRDDIGFEIKSDERLLQQMLRDRGYATGGVVSAYLLRKETGISRGFDFFDGDMPPNPDERPIEQVRRDGAESEAIAEHWLAQQRSSRVFAFLHLNEPHKPYAPPPNYHEYEPYDGEIAYADEIIARLIRYLKSHQLYDRSTIILLSDHGEGLGDHGEQEHGLFIYDESIHVPLIVKQAGGAGSGKRITDVVQLVDVVPTILEFAKAPIPGSLRGRSLQPLLDGTGRLRNQPVYSEALYAHYRFGSSELSGLTDERFRYIRAPAEELYDLKTDRSERLNLATVDPKTREARRRAVDRLHALTPGDDGLVDPKERRDAVEEYRQAIDLATEHKWPQAIALLQRVAHANPELVEVWRRMAEVAYRGHRFDVAAAAYAHVIELTPDDPSGFLGAATALFKLRKLDDARDRAQIAADISTEDDTKSRAAAHELLATIALIRHDIDTARQEADLAQQENPDLPMPAYVEGRLLYDQGRFADALLYFEEAIATAKKNPAVRLAELHLFAGETLMRLDRVSEAETELLEEIRNFPMSTRARAELTTLYHRAGRVQETEQAIGDLIRFVSTPDAYAIAARLWTSFGNRSQADAVRAEARRTLSDHPSPVRRGPGH
jgi:arylsulfatase A-like enzyme/Tfp pilus assembly protein PilF